MDGLLESSAGPDWTLWTQFSMDGGSRGAGTDCPEGVVNLDQTEMDIDGEDASSSGNSNGEQGSLEGSASDLDGFDHGYGVAYGDMQFVPSSGWMDFDKFDSGRLGGLTANGAGSGVFGSAGEAVAAFQAVPGQLHGQVQPQPQVQQVLQRGQRGQQVQTQGQVQAQLQPQVQPHAQAQAQAAPTPTPLFPSSSRPGACLVAFGDTQVDSSFSLPSPSPSPQFFQQLQLQLQHQNQQPNPVTFPPSQPPLQYVAGIATNLIYQQDSPTGVPNSKSSSLPTPPAPASSAFRSSCFFSDLHPDTGLATPAVGYPSSQPYIESESCSSINSSSTSTTSSPNYTASDTTAADFALTPSDTTPPSKPTATTLKRPFRASGWSTCQLSLPNTPKSPPLPMTQTTAPITGLQPLPTATVTAESSAFAPSLAPDSLPPKKRGRKIGSPDKSRKENVAPPAKKRPRGRPRLSEALDDACASEVSHSLLCHIRV